MVEMLLILSTEEVLGKFIRLISRSMLYWMQFALIIIEWYKQRDVMFGLLGS